jgi:hypothetical protein
MAGLVPAIPLLLEMPRRVRRGSGEATSKLRAPLEFAARAGVVSLLRHEAVVAGELTER